MFELERPDSVQLGLVLAMGATSPGISHVNNPHALQAQPVKVGGTVQLPANDRTNDAEFQMKVPQYCTFGKDRPPP